MEKQVRFAVIGTGIGRSHMSGCLLNNNTALAAICDPDIGRLKETGDLFAVPEDARYTDYRQMLLRDDIDAVVVGSPDPFHAEQTIAAMESGRHVLCEKPFALTVEECKSMIEAQRRTGMKLMVGQVCRYAPGFVKAKELVDTGVIGDVFFAETEYAHDYSKIPGKDVNGVPLNWRQDPRRHGILGGGCHALDLIRWIVGNPTEVTAYANKTMLKDWPTDDTTISIMKFPSGAIGKVFCSIAVKRNYTMRSCFYGSRGSIICDNTSPFLTLYRTDLEEQGIRFTVPIQIPISVNNHNTAAELNEFAKIILEDLPVRTDAIEGASTVALALAAVESTKTGAPVKVSYDF